MWRILERLIPKQGAADRIIKSGVWAILLNVSDRLLQILKLIILARLLSPRDFGLIGIGYLTLGAMRKLSQLGIEQELIQRKQDSVNESLNTAWLLKIFRGLLILLIAYTAAPAIAQFFGEPRATDIIRVLGIIPLFVGLENPATVYFHKNLEFHKEFVVDMSKSIVDVVVSIVLAVIFQNVWALVFGAVAGNVVRTLASYGVHEYRPGFDFSMADARQIVGYGKWITGGSIVIFFTTQGDDAFVGWFLTATALGYYQIAYRFGKAPASEITKVLTSVLFPAFSELQDETSELSDLYLKSVKLTALISVPMAAGIAVVASVFVKSALGTEWVPAIVLLEIVAVHGLITSIGSISGPIVMAKGRPDLRTKWQVLNFVLLATLIYPLAVKWETAGVAVAVVLASSVTASVSLYFATRFADVRFHELAQALVYPAVGSTLMAVVIYTLKLSHFSSGILSLVVLITVGMVVYFTSVLVMDRYLGYSVTPILRIISSRIAS